MSASERSGGPHPLSAGEVLRGAVAVYRAHPRIVGGLAVLIFGVAAVADTIGDLLVHGAVESATAKLIIAVLAGPVSVSSAALVFYSGALDRIVGHHLHGLEKPTTWGTLKDLPWLRLLLADVILMSVVAVASAVALIPGLAVFTLWCIVGPVINIESHGVLVALRRSAGLILPRFWLAFSLVTIPVLLENSMLHGLHFVAADRPLLAAFLVSGAIGVVIGAFIGLVEVALAHALIAANKRTELIDVEELAG